MAKKKELTVEDRLRALYDLQLIDSRIDEIRNVYKARRDVLVESFSRSGWDVPSPKATMFAWSPLPDKYKNLSSSKYFSISSTLIFLLKVL